jgi:hypothetical protein
MSLRTWMSTYELVWWTAWLLLALAWVLWEVFR